ncbi:translation initiation factor IF-2-like [Oryza brachyantha]|uniref:translation initiation factor IF-2-like n=1 Tax=Oryza brachyantha TaxID=4533 RepID=UPI001ADC7F59|nr:translation initiation factor IF-2-like [Oryza brachyantha]
MSGHSRRSSSSSDGQRQCHRRAGVTVDVELDAAMALADMAGASPGQPEAPPPPPEQHAAQAAAKAEQEDEAELASTRLSLELGKVGIQSSSPCSSSSSAGHPALQPAAATAAPGYGPRPRHMLTEAEKEAKRLRRVLANRESARQTILRRQAIRDELARKVADLSSQNETMKKEKDVVMQEYLSLKETNKQLKEQVAIRTSKKVAASVAEPMDVSPPVQAVQQQAEGVATTATPPSTPPQPGFLYTAAPPAVPVPYVWGSWPGYEHDNPGGGAGLAAPPLCLPPCAWYYPVVADPRGTSPPASTYPQPFQEQPTSSPGGGTAEEDTDDDPCSLTLAIDVDKRGASSSAPTSGAGSAGHHVPLTDREKAATAAEARKRRKELTKLKQMHGGGGPRPGGEHW